MRHIVFGMFCLLRCNNAKFTVHMENGSVCCEGNGLVLSFDCNNAEFSVQMGNGSVCWDGEHQSIGIGNGGVLSFSV